MSQTKAQLVTPLAAAGIVTAAGVVATGVVTATSFDGDVVGSATSIISGGNLNVGIISATNFSGDFTGSATGIQTGAAIKVGSFTATSFTGDFTGTATSMMRGTGFEAGAVNATGFVADVTGDVTGNATGLAGSVTSGGNIHIGVMTATSYVGDGSNLTGIAATNYNTQTVTANSAETIIDLADGNMITMNQSANTTVGFASTSTAMDITIIRVKDSNTTARTITWPDSISWDGGTAPTLVDKNPSGEESDQIQLLTRDGGLTWYGWLPFSNNKTEVPLFAWGQNYSGELAQNNPGPSFKSSPIQIGSGTNWDKDKISVSRYFFTATKTDGTTWICGTNEFGILGQNESPGPSPNVSARSSPIQLTGSWSQFAGGYEFTTATKTDGTAWSWGSNTYGCLGLNQEGPASHPSNVKYSSPVQIGTDTTWDNVELMANRTGSGVKTDGTLWVWGSNSLGALGQNSPVYAHRSSPTQMGTGTDWTSNTRGPFGNAGLAIKTDGTLWAWGYNGQGQLGLNKNYAGSTPAYGGLSSPAQVGTDTTWSKLRGNGNGVIAQKTDNTIWGWGSNSYGALGQNSTTYHSSPVQIPGTTWSTDSISGSYKAGAALKTDGTLWTWGNNDNGMGGVNTKNPVMYSSPVQIPGTDWTSIHGGSAQRFMIATQSI